jgi:IS30 family transposase
MITERQAHIWFLHHAGMSARQIADKLASTPAAVQDALNRARRRAMQAGIRVVRDQMIPSPVFEMPREVPPSRFEQMKQLAAEIHNERKTNIRH